MHKKLRLLSILIVLFSVQSIVVFSDIRTENIELFLVFDKSKSMVEEIRDVTDYINATFIEDFLIPGDRLVLIQFYGKADLIFSGTITESDKINVVTDLSAIEADGRYTDIGNALDTLNTEVGRSDSGLRRYLILLTDGKQEAPPESIYYSPDGSFNHFFLENTKIIQKSGWKIIILGIGEDTIVEELADELGTTHEVIDFSEAEPSPKTSDEIIGRITASGFSIEDGVLRFTLESSDYQDLRTVVIEEITYQLPNGNFLLNDESISISVPASGQIDAEIELSPGLLDSVLNDGTSGNIIFKFGGDTPFLPSYFEVILQSVDNLYAPDEKFSSDTDSIEEKSENDGNKEVNWLIIIIVILAAGAVVAIIIIRNLILHRDKEERNGKEQNAISGDS